MAAQQGQVENGELPYRSQSIASAFAKRIEASDQVPAADVRTENTRDETIHRLE